LTLQGSLADMGAGAKRLGRTSAEAVGSPELVSLDNVFGYRLDGTSGIRVPWLAIPSDGSSLRPFTISVGVSLDDPGSAGSIVNAVSADGSFSLTIGMNQQTGAPEARIVSTGSPAVVVPWGGPPITARQRVLLSFSAAPVSAGLATQWFLNGVQISSQVIHAVLGGPRQEGSVTIGGEHGFAGVVDEFGVYAVDPAGRPATDPFLFSRAREAEYGSRLVFADGFDGLSLYNGFSLEGAGQLAGGFVALGPGGRLVLPPMKPGESVTVSAALSATSARNASLVVLPEAGAQPAAVVPVSVGASGLSFRVAADARSVVVTSTDGDKTVSLPAVSGSTGMIVKIGNPADARSDLAIDSILALKPGP
ncbi:MAG TPA: hypothetical protein VL359_09060, partial [bacterium]|nr:hypothetical protein [bacterium]